VRITAGAERGFGSLAGNAAAKPGDDDEAKAAARLTAAKELLDKGRNATARAVLNAVVDKYPKTKAAADAKALLEKLDK
jgi:TolA-binding protein